MVAMGANEASPPDDTRNAGSEPDVARAITIADLRALALDRLEPAAVEWLEAGAADERTVAWNRSAFDRIGLSPRLPREPASLDTTLTLFGDALSLPVLLSPVAYQRMLHPDGEKATAAGASRAGAHWVVSTGTTTSLDDIRAASAGPLWFQLYLQHDRAFTGDLVRLAEDAGCRALVLTIDTPVIGARDRQRRAGFRLPAGATTPYLSDVNSGVRAIAATARVVPTWKDIAWLRGHTKLPLLIKGILAPDEADVAVAEGADGVIVSNHGGRNLDTLPASIDALPLVADRIGGRAPVLMDGGIRRGTDIVTALALGATAVLVGRPYLWGLAAGGAAGVERAIAILREELEMAMLLTGRPTVGSIDRTVIWPEG
jgi:4-hydroxymandelate oxidase